MKNGKHVNLYFTKERMCMSHNHKKRCFVSLVVRGILSMTIFKFYYLLITYQQLRRLTMWDRMRINVTPYILLVEMYIGVANVSISTLEKYLALAWILSDIQGDFCEMFIWIYDNKSWKQSKKNMMEYYRAVRITFNYLPYMGDS